MLLDKVPASSQEIEKYLEANMKTFTLEGKERSDFSLYASSLCQSHGVRYICPNFASYTSKNLLDSSSGPKRIDSNSIM
jgi:hypothetical protein